MEKNKKIILFRAFSIYFIIFFFNHFFLKYPSKILDFFIRIFNVDYLKLLLFLHGKWPVYSIFESAKYIMAISFPSLIIIFMIIIIYRKIEKKPLETMGLKNPFEDKISILIAVLLVIINLVSFYIYSKIGHDIFRNILELSFLSGLRFIIIPFSYIMSYSFAGELMQRGFLQSIITNQIGKVKSIIIIGLIDLLVHLIYYDNPLTLLYIFLKSLFVGYLFSRKNNLSSPFIYYSLDTFVLWLAGKEI